MGMPQIRMDWTINLGSMISLMVFVLSMLGGWFALREQVAVNKAIIDQKIIAIDSSITDIKTEIVRNTTEIKSDIHDLRSDIKTMRR